jgi:hypothetical protein
VAWREDRVRFWAAIAQGVSSEDAAACAARKHDFAVTTGFVWRFVYWLACAVLIGMAYRLGRRVLGVLGAVARSDGP